jgi:hypothetical protein
VTIGNHVTSIGWKTFYYCSSIEKIIIPSSVKWIEGNAFGGCVNLKEMMFYGDAPKIEVYIGDLHPDAKIVALPNKTGFGKTFQGYPVVLGDGGSIIVDPPAITQQPEDKEIHHGEDVEFHIAANGTHPIEFQWYKNGKQIKGATDTVLKLDDVTKEDEAIYSVKVTSDFGIARSRIAQLIVKTDPPSITIQPKDTHADLGEYTEFSVAVKGTEPFDYQWYKNGKIIQDGNKATLVIPSVSENDITIYSVRIKNQFGKAISRIAELKLKTPTPPDPIEPTEIVPYKGHLVFEIITKGNALGKPHDVQFSTDNETWTTLETLTLNKETTLYLDKTGVGNPKRFYRVKLKE